MWIFLNNAFLSIVADLNNADNLLVRARRAGDIERVFPSAKATETPTGDYRFRASLPRPIVASAMQAAVLKIVYPNFKDSTKDRKRKSVYLRVWRTMWEWQQSLRPAVGTNVPESGTNVPMRNLGGSGR
jgi:hypothetical protein